VAETLGNIGTGRKALVAEDNRFNLILARKLLEKEGIQVETVVDGQAAVAAVRSTTYDLIFMDVQMPVMNGYEATFEIRELQQVSGEHTPIVAMTADALQGDEEKCLAAGMDDYLSKPIDPKKLRKTLAKYITSERAKIQS